MVLRINAKTVITLLVLALTLLLILVREEHWQFKPTAAAIFKTRRAETPEDALYKMLDAASIGDTKAYLDCFAGDLRQQLTQVIHETSTAQFAQYLSSQNSAFTGVAVSATDNANPGNARLRVEYIYPERNEVQTVYLRRDPDNWKIVQVTGSEQIKTLIPFGTRVSE